MSIPKEVLHWNQAKMMMTMTKMILPATAVKPGIYGLAFTMGKWFLTDNSATVGRILMISSADPHEIFDRYSIPYSQGWSRSAHRAVLD